jgi:hypothetical protein
VIDGQLSKQCPIHTFAQHVSDGSCGLFFDGYNGTSQEQAQFENQ